MHHNLHAIPMMLQILIDCGGGKCVRTARDATELLCLSRSVFRLDLGWIVLSQCAIADGTFHGTAEEFFTKLQPHVRPYLLASPDAMRTFFSRSGLFTRDLPLDNAQYMAWCIFGDLEKAKHLLEIAIDPVAVLEELVELCGVAQAYEIGKNSYFFFLSL